jgi:hypothetical protein
VKTVRPIFVSPYSPERCGMATFTQNLADAVDLAAGDAVSSVMAIGETRPLAAAEPRIVHTIGNDQPSAYRLAAEVANHADGNVVSLQHDFKLYPGPWGNRILEFLNACHKPIVTTFHALMTEPDPAPRRIIRELANLSQGVVVMTIVAEKLLDEVYHVSGPKVRVIPCGVPEPLTGSDGQRACEYTPPMFWPNVAREYLEVFDQVAAVREQRLERRFLGAFVPRHGYGQTTDPLPGHV